jgi:hypothetical protein
MYLKTKQWHITTHRLEQKSRRDSPNIVYVRGTIGGDRIQYDGMGIHTAAHMYTASMQLIKLLLNAVVSDTGAKFMTADIYISKTSTWALPYPTQNTCMRINLNHIHEDAMSFRNTICASLNIMAQ